MGRYIDKLNVLADGVVGSGIMGYLLALFGGVFRAWGGLMLLVVFLFWGTGALYVRTWPGRRLLLAMASDSKPAQFPPVIRRALRIGTEADIRARANVVSEAVQAWEWTCVKCTDT